MRLGQILKETRIKRGTSLSEVAKELLITEEYIEAIEDGIDDILPSGTYKRIYTRAYCKYLGVEYRDDSKKKETAQSDDVEEYYVSDELDEITKKPSSENEPENLELAFDCNRTFRISIKILGTIFVIYLLVRLISHLFS